MSHLMVRVTDFEIVGPYTMQLTFDDGISQTIDFEPVLYGYYLGPLRHIELFNQVQIDPDFYTLVWPNDADFDPATLYNWHKGDGAELAERAKRWKMLDLTSAA